MSARQAQVARAVDDLLHKHGANSSQQSDRESNAEVTAQFLEAIRLLGPTIVFDVGAYDGRASIRARQALART